MAKKTYNEKLNSKNDLPKVVDLSKNSEAKARMGGTKMLVAPPQFYNDVMAKIPYGKLTTLFFMRKYLAQKSNADTTCPLTAGIFTNLCANASEERTENKIPWWRTLKTNGELNPKYPNSQRELLEAEGHTIVQKGARQFVKDYESYLFDLWQS